MLVGCLDDGDGWKDDDFDCSLRADLLVEPFAAMSIKRLVRRPTKRRVRFHPSLSRLAMFLS
jgi:hypothetical protein